MRELENSRIYFDNRNGIYKPGDIVSGHVELNFNSAKTVQGVSIKILGEARVEWSESESTTNSDGSSSSNTVYYTNREIYFKQKYYVAFNEDGSKIELSAGQHIYPFKYTLPTDIPPSFDHNTGSVKYSVKVTLDRPWKINQFVLQPFIVNTLCTILNNPTANIPGILVLEKKFGLIFKSKPLRVVVRTKHCGFSAGQIIPLSFDIKNESDTKVSYITVKLQQMFKFYATSSTKKERVILAKSGMFDKIKPKVSTQFTHNLQVPNTIVISDLSKCKIIDCYYEIRVKLHTSGLTTNLSGEFTMYPVT